MDARGFCFQTINMDCVTQFHANNLLCLAGIIDELPYARKLLKI